MRLHDLENKHVVIWGAAREAGAFLNAVRTLNLDVTVSIVDEGAGVGGSFQGIAVEPLSLENLNSGDFVLRSPGVSIYRPELMGRKVITATQLWFAEPHAPVIAVTGTKGKSTTASLIAHLLNGLGVETRLAGNIGRSPLDFMGEPEPQMWVVELSSFQISDANAEPDVAVLTSLDSDHLDWHGDQQHYIDDKLRLFERAHMSVANFADPGVGAVVGRLNNVIVVDDSRVVPPSQLFGPHNAQLIRLALAVLDAVDVDTVGRASEIADAIATFAPLPHRLEPVREINGTLYVNDSLSTNPIAATAAVKAFVGRPISLLLGGYDRGLSYDEFGRFLSELHDLRIYTMPDCGDRIAASINSAVPIVHTDGLAEAVRLAHEQTPQGGVVLLAPAAASFGQFSNYAERGDAFRSLITELSSNSLHKG
jgi:UDP-N-acetylmuramoyl-L-alanine---L-glutamate ligase